MNQRANCKKKTWPRVGRSREHRDEGLRQDTVSDPSRRAPQPRGNFGESHSEKKTRPGTIGS